MDFTFTEEQETIAKVARQLFEHRATPEHLTELEAGEVRYDAALWRELASADLLGISLPESVGGSGHGFLELALLLAEVGWSVAPVPVYATLLLGADTIARLRRRRTAAALPARRRRRLTAAHRGVGGAGSLRPDRDRRPPRVATATAGASTASRSWCPRPSSRAPSLIPATLDDGDVGVFLLDADSDGVEIRPVATTNGEPHADVILDGAARFRTASR